MATVNKSSTVRAFFGDKASSWSRNYDTGGSMVGRLSLFSEALSSRLKSGGHILDFGCGSGDLSRHMSAQGWQVTGCDITPEMIEVAKGCDPNKDVAWFVLEPGPLPFSSPCFDGIVSSSVFEYLDDPRATIAALAAALKPGGILVISCPDLRHPLRWREAVERAILWLPGIADFLCGTRFAGRVAYLKVSRQRLSLARWGDLLAEAGLSIEPPEPCYGPLTILVARKPIGRLLSDASLPAEDIFGNTKKLKFIEAVITSHRARLDRDLNILDFGCGNAQALGRHLIQSGVRYVGVDFHPPSLAYARDHFTAPNARFVPDVPPDIIFDVIVYADVLEHLDDPLESLAAHLRQLAPDGVVVGSVPNGYGPCEIEKFIDRHLRLYKGLRWLKRAVVHLVRRSSRKLMPMPYNAESGHVVFFTIRRFQDMVASAGLRIVRFAHGGFVGADLTGSTIFADPRFIEWNLRAADLLPSWAVSTWYFVLVRA